MANARYFFLDTWVLSEYSHDERTQQLAKLLEREGAIGVVNSLTLVESYNPGWTGGAATERGARVARLLATLRCAIINPVAVVRAELLSFPAPLASPPIALDLSASRLAREAILGFLRADPLFLQQGKDVREWARSYVRQKADWSRSVQEIIRAAIEDGLVVRNGGRLSFSSESRREDFLRSLDTRHLGVLTTQERETLRPHIIDLVLNGRMATLPAVRLSSLLFVAQYIDATGGGAVTAAGSDIGDHLHAQIAPYCGTMTVDRRIRPHIATALERLGRRVRVLDQDQLAEAVAGAAA